MPCDELTSYYTDLLDGSYSCLDRLVLNANFAPCYSAGGFRWWWRQLHNGSDEELDDAHLMRMAGTLVVACAAGPKPNEFQSSIAAAKRTSMNSQRSISRTIPGSVGSF